MQDAKIVGGPLDGKIMDLSGGWHDAGDYIKFMITITNTTYFLLFAYKENPELFSDNYLADGMPGKNNIPDVLDEAKYGLDFIMKMHPEKNVLLYQVGGEEDHATFRLPFNDIANYKTKPYRPAYYGAGANICGRAAASLALAYTIWKEKLNNENYAKKCLKHAKEIFRLGKKNMFAIDSNPDEYYNENTFYDDMELGAIELYKATKNDLYLKLAQTYAMKCGSGKGWLDWGTINFIAHYELYPYASSFTKELLKNYMKDDLEKNFSIYKNNPFGMSVEYVWGSMSVLTGTFIKGVLYKKLFGDKKYDEMTLSARDYLLGKNPWGVCFIVGYGYNYPKNVHGQIPQLLKKEVFGTPIEGPLSQKEFSSLGIRLSGKDRYAKFNSPIAVYHDNKEDYSSNEMTIFQGALTLTMFSFLSTDKKCKDKVPYIRK